MVSATIFCLLGCKTLTSNFTPGSSNVCGLWTAKRLFNAFNRLALQNVLNGFFQCRGFTRHSRSLSHISPKLIIPLNEAQRRRQSMMESEENGSKMIGKRLTETFPRTILDGAHVTSSAAAVPVHIVRPDYANHPRGLPNANTRAVNVNNGINVIRKPPSNINRHIEKMYKAGELARQCLHIALLSSKASATTDDIDRLIHQHIISNNAYPAAINYYNFPRSLCASVNEVACHGIPCNRPLVAGDLCSFDCTVYVDGVFGDCCGTVIVGENYDMEYGDDTSLRLDVCDGNSSQFNTVSIRNATADSLNTVFTEKGINTVTLNRSVIHRVLNRVTYESVVHAIKHVGPGNSLNTIAKLITNYLRKFNTQLFPHYYNLFNYEATPDQNIVVSVDQSGKVSVKGSSLKEAPIPVSQIPSYSFQIIKDFCGHFIGEQMHMEPLVRHLDLPNNGGTHSSSSYILKPNDIFTIEPILVEGSNSVYTFDDGWSVCTYDNGYASQWEHTIIITENGADVITRLKHPFHVPSL